MVGYLRGSCIFSLMTVATGWLSGFGGIVITPVDGSISQPSDST